jgi:hypothetical protein
MARRRPVWLRRAITLAFVLGVAATPPSAPPVAAYSGISQFHGFDACSAPSSATMDAWWPGTPYSTIAIYIGGANRACLQPNLTAAWVTHNKGLWAMIPTWVGAQMGNDSCTNLKVWNTNISTDLATAYQQGRDEASAAFTAATNLGFDTLNMPIAYDLEAYSGGKLPQSTCRNVAKQFMKGWADGLAVNPAQLSGAYGSACASFLDDFASNGNPPDFLWMGDHSGNTHVTVVTNNCVPANHWTQSQRHKQYQGPHSETHGGFALTIDSDCSNGPVYYPTNRFSSGSDCL